MPARRSTAKSCSRNWTGMSRRRASSAIGTGPAPDRASSTSARRAYGGLDETDSTAPDRMARDGRLQPAALGGEQHRLRAIHGAELAVDVVQVGPHGAGGQLQLVGDLLVDLALRQALEDLHLPRG